jgi:hypothetical protein
MPSKNQKKAKKEAQAKAAASSNAPPENFEKIITDMCSDLTNTFPEYAAQWSKWTRDSFATMDEETRAQETQTLFNYCMTVFPERFFDILYKNADIFKPESDVPTCFLPSVDFKVLFNCEGVSENTGKVMWNYLQLILFTVIGNVHDKARFGDTKNIFDGIDESDLFEKLTETMNNMTSFFQEMHGEEEEEEDGEAAEDGSKEPSGDGTKREDREEIPIPPQFPKMPNIKELHEHLKGLFDGKIGALAKELAEEITGDLSSILGEEAKDIRSTKEVLQKLMKNPAKISELVKTIGEKLKKKLSSGEVSQEELMKEATEMLNKMKDMGGGMDQFKEMFKNMGMNIPKNAKVNMNALNRMTQQQSTRERLKARMMQKKAAEAEAFLKHMAQQQQQQQDQQQQQPPSMQDLEALSKQLGLDLNETVGAPGNAPTKKTKKPKKK